MEIEIVFTDRTTSTVYGQDWYARDGLLTVCINSVTREFQYFPLANIKTWKKIQGR